MTPWYSTTATVDGPLLSDSHVTCFLNAGSALHMHAVVTQYCQDCTLECPVSSSHNLTLAAVSLYINYSDHVVTSDCDNSGRLRLRIKWYVRPPSAPHSTDHRTERRNAVM